MSIAADFVTQIQYAQRQYAVIITYDDDAPNPIDEAGSYMDEQAEYVLTVLEAPAGLTCPAGEEMRLYAFEDGSYAYNYGHRFDWENTEVVPPALTSWAKAICQGADSDPAEPESLHPEQERMVAAVAKSNLVLEAPVPVASPVDPEPTHPALRGLPQGLAQKVEEALKDSWAESTLKKWQGQFQRVSDWAQENNLVPLPLTPATAAAFVTSLSDRTLPSGTTPRFTTIKSYADAISAAHRFDEAPDPTKNDMFRQIMRGLKRRAARLGETPRQAKGLDATAMIAVMQTAHQPRTTRGGNTELPFAAKSRGDTDIALCRTMRDALLRRVEASGLTWGDITELPDGTGLLRLGITKNAPTGETRALRLSGMSMTSLNLIRPPNARSGTSVFGLSDKQIARRIAAAAKAAGLGEGYKGHSPRVGMAQDLKVAGYSDEQIQKAGRWKSRRMVALYTRNSPTSDDVIIQWYDRDGTKDIGRP